MYYGEQGPDLFHNFIPTIAHIVVYIFQCAGVLEALKKRAEPPTEQEFIVAYQKCKYGINLISKLGHHLSSPSPTQLLKGFFVYVQEMVNMNKG
jgi:hypothetical protein